MPYFQDPVGEIIDLYAYEARKRRIQARAAQFSPDQAGLVGSYARFTPWMPAGVNLSLSQAGVPPTDPRVASISDLTAYDEYKNDLEHFNAQMSNPTVRAAVGEEKIEAVNSSGFAGMAVGEALARPAREEQGRKLSEAGWAPLSQIAEQNPNLAAAINANGIVIQDDVALRPKKLHSRKGQAFARLEEAFKEEGVGLPYMNVGDDWGDRADEMGIINREGTTNLADILGLPTKPIEGGGQYAGSRMDLGPLNFIYKLGGSRKPQDLMMQDRLRQAGIPIDPNDPFAPAALLTRPATIIMDAPAQELQGQFRNVIGALHGKPVNWLESQSDLGIVFGAAQQGRSLDTGQGYFVDPESEVARERRNREAKRGLIGGHNITFGRFLADTVTEPDTLPFNVLSGVVDAGVQVADPVTYGLGKFGEVRAARAMFEAEEAYHVEAGLGNWLRRSFHGPTAESWLNGKDGLRAIERLTDADDPATVWKAMNRRIDPDVAAAFADTRTTDETRSLLEGLLGPKIRTTTEMKAASRNLVSDVDMNPLVARMNKLNPRVSQSRLLRWMPQGQADTYNPRDFAIQLERHMINAKVPVELQDEVLNQIARSKTRAGLYDAATKAMGHEAGILSKYGVDPEKARQLTTMFRETYDTHLNGFVDEVGDDVPTWTKMSVGGKMEDVPGPHLVIEHLNRYVPLPDARRIRRLTSNPGLRFLTTTKSPAAFGQTRFPVAMMDFVTQEIWKTSTLLGRFPAWITRVVGESQLRMATAGLDSMFSHPLAYFGWALGKKGLIDPSGIGLEDLEEFRGSLTAGHGGWLSRPGVVSSSKPVAIPKRPEYLSQYLDAWSGELTELAYDPISKNILNNGIDETERWLRVSEEGQKHLRFLQEAHPGNLQTHAQLQEYLHSISRRITIKTGGNTELIEALKLGKLNDVPLLRNVNQTNPKFTKALETYMERHGPDQVKGLEVDFKHAGHAFYDRWNRAVDSMFAMTMGFADNLWDRAPVFKQYLWQHTAELLPFADDATRAAVLANAEKANLPERMMKGLRRAANRGQRGAKDLTLEELTTLARGYAADSAKRLLYDLNEKGQLADAMRIVAPFGNAYQEIFGAWSKLLNQIGGPGVTGKIVGSLKLLRRADQLMGGLRGTEFGSVMGAPTDIDGQQQGFFFKDERDQEVFVIPGSQWVTNAVAGVPVPLTGSVQGLNMVGSIIPGLGPVAAIPTAYMIQNKPQFKGIHDLLLPYGAPGEREPSDITQLLNYAPPWMRRAFDAASNGGYDQRTWANAQKDAMSYLFSTGKYDTTSRQGLNKLLHDAKDAARDIYMIRSFAQTFSPTTPSFRFLTEDKSGRLLSTAALVEEFYELQEADYDHAAQNFMQQYGPNAILATIPKSASSTYGIPRTVEQRDFILRNPDLKANFPSTYGFFLPQEGEFDYDTYLDSFFSGDREDLSPSQWLNLSNSIRGDHLYNLYKEQVEGRNDKVARDWLRQVRQQIQELYPSGPTGVPEKPDTDELIREFYQAIEDPTVAETDAGQGIAMYLTYRDQAMGAATALGRSGFDRSQDTEYLRIWLNQVADAIIERHPDFQFAWDIVLSRETQVEENAEG